MAKRKKGGARVINMKFASQKVNSALRSLARKVAKVRPRKKGVHIRVRAIIGAGPAKQKSIRVYGRGKKAMVSARKGFK